LVQALSDKDREVVEAAVIGLGIIGQPAADDALVRILTEAAGTARRKGLAALSLGLSGGDGAPDALFKNLGAGKPLLGEAARTVGAALWTGGDKRDPRTDRSQDAAKKIQQALTEEFKNRKYVGLGLAGLARPRSPDCVKFVAGLLSEPRADVRAAAAIAA